MNIEDNNSDKNGKRDENHGEQEILADERHDKRSWGYELGKKQKEHSKRKENAHTERNLLATVARQVEREHSEERDAHARHNQVDRIEERLATQRDVERDVRVRFRTARVRLDVAPRWHVHDVPFDALVVVAKVYTDRDLVALVVLLVDVNQVHLKAVVCPAFLSYNKMIISKCIEIFDF